MNILNTISKYRKLDPAYAQDLQTAMYVIGGEELDKMLSKAEKEGKRLELTYPIPPEVGPSEPNGVKVI